MPNISSNQLHEAIEIAKTETEIIILYNRLYPAPIGKWITCGTVDNPKGMAGRFKVEPDCIHFYNWQTGAKYTHFFNKPQRKKSTIVERKQLQQQINQKIADDKATQDQEKQKQAKCHRDKFLRLNPCIRHPYADRKGLENLYNYNFKIDNYGNLVISFFNTAGVMMGYQSIRPYKVTNKPDKRIVGGYSGCYWQFPHVNINPALSNYTNSVYLLGEGIATCLSAYEAINYYWDSKSIYCYVLCGFSAGNLSKVIKATAHNNFTYYLLVDNDASNPQRNTGIETAYKIIKDHPNLNIYSVVAKSINGQNLDINDYILSYGKENLTPGREAFCRLLQSQTNIDKLIAGDIR